MQRERKAINAILEPSRWAVSADNGQPWKFYWRDSRLFVLLDSSRAASFFDGRLYAPYMGLGSLLENLCIAARHTGYEPHVDLLPGAEIDHEQVVASIIFSPSHAQESLLYPTIFDRKTNRRAYHSTAVPLGVRIALEKSAEAFTDFRIKLVEESSLNSRLAVMTARAEAIRFDFARKDVHADFFECLRFTRKQAEQTGDGLWIRCLEVGFAATLALRVLANWRCAALAARLGAHRAFAHQSVHLLRRTPLVALVISCSRDSQPSETDFLTAGRVCQRLWLTATLHQVSCQPMAALPLFFLQHDRFGDQGFPGKRGAEVGRLREEFGSTFNLERGENLLMVFRLGFAKPPRARSFRRPLKDLLTFSDGSPISPERKS